jgi:Arc/MetJ-type ribon-helix-helix transcriptional regulator
MGKWHVQVRKRGHKPINKTLSSKYDALKWARETERLIEMGQFVDTSEANKTTLAELLERYEREVSSKKRTTADKYLIRNICQHDFVHKVLAQISSSDIAKFRDERLKIVTEVPIVDIDCDVLLEAITIIGISFVSANE